jgi:hypothetical protein
MLSLAPSPQTLITTSKITQYHNQEDQNLNFYHSENLKLHTYIDVISVGVIQIKSSLLVIICEKSLTWDMQ